MTLVEYAEKVSPVPLSGWQKKCFQAFEKAETEHKIIAIMPARNIGRAEMLRILNDWEKFKESQMNDNTIVKNKISQEIIDKAETIACLISSGKHVELCVNKDGLRIIEMDRKVVK